LRIRSGVEKRSLTLTVKISQRENRAQLSV